jgi:hypothetical protein
MAKFTSQEVTALQEGGNQVFMLFCAKTRAICLFNLLEIIYFLSLFQLYLLLAACKRDLF